MNLNNSELEFVTRLIGHHLTSNGDASGIQKLYDRLRDHAEFRGIRRLDKPLSMRIAHDPENLYPGRVVISLNSWAWDIEAESDA